MSVALAGNVLLIASALFATTSVILHLRVPWWRSDMGRHLMAYMAVIAATVDLGVLRMLLGDSHPFRIVRLVVFALVPVVLAWRAWLQLKAQLRTER